MVSIEDFFLDSKSFSVTAHGSADLVNNQIDAVVLPRKRSTLFNNVTPVKINGPLNSPSVSTIPWRVAATTYEEFALAPVVIGLSVTKMITDKFRSKKLSPCEQRVAQILEEAEREK